MISVVIPSLNGAAWLDEALASVRDQGDLVSEIVVVDDGSTDEIAKVLARHPDVVSIRNEVPRGPAAARNVGVSATSSPFVSFLDVDDLWTPTALRQRLSLLQDEQCDLVVTRFFSRAMDDAECEVPSALDGWWSFSFGTALVTRAAWARIGPIDESLLRGEDTEWWLRARGSGIRIQRADCVTLVVRTRPDSWAAEPAVRTAATFEVIRRRLAGR